MEVLSALELKKQQPPCHGVHTGELDRISPNVVLELPAGNYRGGWRKLRWLYVHMVY